MKFYNLETCYDARESFYGKTKVIEIGNIEMLISYDTPVLLYLKKENIFINLIDIDDSLYSSTTSRHINEFLSQTFGGRYTQIRKNL